MMTDYVIIVAGGRGLRMGSDVPKQFLPIGGRPVLMRTIERFREYSERLKIILVLPKEQQDYWKQLCKEYGFNIDYQLANGGETRFHSVSNGLALIADDETGTVAIHDGVRPFVSLSVIGSCYDAAKTYGAAIPVTPVVETLRHVNGSTVPRSDYRLVQTPQTFNIQLLKKSYRQPYCDAFTDDASVAEHAGYKIHTVEGNRENIKITTPFDMIVGEGVLNSF